MSNHMHSIRFVSFQRVYGYHVSLPFAVSHVSSRFSCVLAETVYASAGVCVCACVIYTVCLNDTHTV